MREGQTHRTLVGKDVDLPASPCEPLDPRPVHLAPHEALKVGDGRRADVARARVGRPVHAVRPGAAAALLEALELGEVPRVLGLDARRELLDDRHEARKVVDVEERADRHGPELREDEGRDCEREQARRQGRSAR